MQSSNMPERRGNKKLVKKLMCPQYGAIYEIKERVDGVVVTTSLRHSLKHYRKNREEKHLDQFNRMEKINKKAG